MYITPIINLNDLISYLNDVDHDFGIPISEKITINYFAEKLLTFGKVFGVKENEEIVSCIGFYCNDNINRNAYLPILSTQKRARGKGYARILVNKMIEECKKCEMKTILCDSINPHAINLYKSIGFVQYNSEDNKVFLKLEL